MIRTQLRLEKRDRVKIVWPVARQIAFSNVLTEIFDACPNIEGNSPARDVNSSRGERLALSARECQSLDLHLPV